MMCDIAALPSLTGPKRMSNQSANEDGIIIRSETLRSETLRAEKLCAKTLHSEVTCAAAAHSVIFMVIVADLLSSSYGS